MIGLLSIAIFLPAVLAAPTFLLGRKNPKLAKILGVGTTAIVFANGARMGGSRRANIAMGPSWSPSAVVYSWW